MNVGRSRVGTSSNKTTTNLLASNEVAPFDESLIKSVDSLRTK